MPPVIALAAAAVAATAAAGWMRREWRRINRELDAAHTPEPPRESLPTLRRDPRTGEWRPV